MSELLINNVNVFNNHIKSSNDLLRQFMGFYWDIFDNEKLYPNSLPLTVMNINSKVKYGMSLPSDRSNLRFKQQVQIVLSGDLGLKTFLDQEYVGDGPDLIARRMNLRIPDDTGGGGGGSDGTGGGVVRPINPNTTPQPQPSDIYTNRKALEDFLKKEEEFEDFNFQLRKTVPKSKDVDIFYSEIESKYQYYVQQYEEISKKIPEELLPNYYIFSLAGNQHLLKDVSQKDYNSSLKYGQNSPYTQFLKKFDKLITLDGNLLFTSNFSMNNIESYLRQYSESYDDVSVDFVQTYKKRFGNLLTSFDSQDIFDRLNSNKQYFPMYVNITFYKDKSNSFFDLLKKANISLSSLQSFILEKVLNKTSGDDSYNKTLFELDQKVFSSGGSLELAAKNRFVMNFDVWFKDFIQNSGVDDTSSTRGQTISIGDEKSKVLDRITGTKRQSLKRIFQKVLKNSSKHKYDEILMNNFRNYKDIVSGKLANNEVLFFRIEKIDKVSNKVVQNFYLPNIPNINIMNYVDTQVIYNKLYSYKIYSVHIVYGTRYKYVLKETSEKVLLPSPIKNVMMEKTFDFVKSPPLAQSKTESFSKKPFSRPDVIGDMLKVSDVLNPQEIDSGALIIPMSAENQDVPISGESDDIPFVIRPDSGGRFAKRMNLKPREDNVGANQTESKTESESNTPIQDGTGNIHRFLDFGINKEDSIIFDAIYWPIVKLVETEYSQEVVSKVIDHPPSLPDVSFYPLMESSGSFNIAIQDSSYEYEDYFIPILQEDVSVFTNLLHGGFSSNGQINFSDNFNKKMKFKGDGDTKEFQVFRTDKEPRSYRDFVLYKTLKYPDESTFLETIEPNKKYYYTFRTKDIHDNISNPTPIYLAEIYNDQLLFIPTFSVFEIKEPSNFDWGKYAKKYIKIAPNIIHKIYNEQNQKLGLGSKNIYGKQFLMRVKSKHTGRVIDIYFKFQLDKNINN